MTPEPTNPPGTPMPLPPTAGQSAWMNAAPPLAYPPPSPERSMQGSVRVGLAVLTLVAVASGLVMALVSINSIIDIWFQYQWVPVARLAMGLVVVAVGLWALRIIMGRQPAV